MRLTNARAFLETLNDPAERRRLAETLATPAQLSTRFGLSPFSTRDVLIHGPVAIRHAGGRPMVNVRAFARALALEPGCSVVSSEPLRKSETHGLYSVGSACSVPDLDGRPGAPFVVRAEDAHDPWEL